VLCPLKEGHLTASSVAELRNQLRKLNQSTRGSKEELIQRIASVRASGAAVGAKQKREGSVLKEGEGQGPRPARAFQQAIDEFTDAGRVHAVLPSSPSEGHVLFKARGVNWQELCCGERHAFFFPSSFFLLLQKSVNSDFHKEKYTRVLT
jgi:hypothetical protein